MRISDTMRQELFHESTQISSPLKRIESISHDLGGIFQNPMELSEEDFNMFADNVKMFEKVVDDSTRELHLRLATYVAKVNALREELKK